MQRTVLAVLALTATLVAQITLMPGDVPQTVGDSVVYKYCTQVSPVQVGQPGGPQIWNFDTASFVGELTSVVIVPLSSTPFEQQFPSANVVQRNRPHSGNELQYVFTTLGVTSYIMLGMGIVTPETSICIVYNPTELLFPLPLHYQDNWRVQYGYEMVIPPARLVEKHWGSPHVDAWGSAVTPVGVSPCLRVNCYDTTAVATYINDTLVYADTFGFRYYIWYSPHLGAVASAAGPEDDTSLIFTQTDCYRVMVAARTGIAEQAHNNPAGSIRVLSNPCKDKPAFVVTAPAAARVRLTILDRSGRQVRTLTAQAGPERTCSLVWDRADELGRGAEPGIYFATAPGLAPLKFVLAD